MDWATVYKYRHRNRMFANLRLFDLLDKDVVKSIAEN